MTAERPHPKERQMFLLNHDLFAAYLLATAALVLIPGPIVTLVVANSLAHGVRTGLATVAGAGRGGTCCCPGCADIRATACGGIQQ